MKPKGHEPPIAEFSDLKNARELIKRIGNKYIIHDRLNNSFILLVRFGNQPEKEYEAKEIGEVITWNGERIGDG